LKPNAAATHADREDNREPGNDRAPVQTEIDQRAITLKRGPPLDNTTLISDKPPQFNAAISQRLPYGRMQR
jgi:hypothetical protein